MPPVFHKACLHVVFKAFNIPNTGYKAGLLAIFSTSKRIMLLFTAYCCPRGWSSGHHFFVSQKSQCWLHGWLTRNLFCTQDFLFCYLLPPVFHKAYLYVVFKQFNIPNTGYKAGLLAIFSLLKTFYFVIYCLLFFTRRVSMLFSKNLIFPTLVTRLVKSQYFPQASKLCCCLLPTVVHEAGLVVTFFLSHKNHNTGYMAGLLAIFSVLITFYFVIYCLLFFTRHVSMLFSNNLIFPTLVTWLVDSQSFLYSRLFILLFTAFCFSQGMYPCCFQTI